MSEIERRLEEAADMQASLLAQSHEEHLRTEEEFNRTHGRLMHEIFLNKGNKHFVSQLDVEMAVAKVGRSL